MAILPLNVLKNEYWYS